MNPEFAEFRRGVINPMECIKEGWALIKDEYWLFFGITLVGMLIGGAFAIVLLGPMMVGIFLCLMQKERNEKVEFATLFKGFDSFVPALIVTVIKMIPMLVMMVPYYIFVFATMVATIPRGQPSPEDSQRFALSFVGIELLFVAGLLVITVIVEIFFMLAYPLVAEHKMSGLDAVKLSIRAAKANLGGIIGLLLLNGLFGFVGVLCCFVGAYFYLPVAYAAHLIAYRRIFPARTSPFPSPPPPPGNWA